MTVEKAMEVIDPDNGLVVPDTGGARHARLLAYFALRSKRPTKVSLNNEKRALMCKRCENTEYLFNQSGERNRYCGYCGQALDWRE